MNCNFPSCRVQLHPEQAWVPAIKAIRQVIGKPVTEEELANRTVCRRHSAVLREQGMRLFSYLGTIAELRRREEEKANAAGYFKLYVPMQAALKAASGNAKARAAMKS